MAPPATGPEATRHMHIYSEHAQRMHWRVFDPTDVVCWVPLAEGDLGPGDSHEFNHGQGRFKLDASAGGQPLTSAGTVFENASTFLYTANSEFKSWNKLSFNHAPRPFSPAQVGHVLDALERIATHLGSCSLPQSTVRALASKIDSGIEISQGPLGPSTWAEARIGGTTIELNEASAWTSARLPALAAVLAHEMIHLIGEDHAGLTPQQYLTSHFHVFELCFP